MTIRVQRSLLSPVDVSRLEAFLLRDGGNVALSHHPACLNALTRGFGHQPYLLEALADGTTRGFLLLNYLSSMLFGRFLVSLPYLNYGGIHADDETAGQALVTRAVELADSLQVRYLELRHTQPLNHPGLGHARTDKVHMHLNLPGSAEALMKQFSAKLRNQVRKAQKQPFSTVWGGADLLKEFYSVFSQNMRDLGTPVFGRRLFRSFLDAFPDRVEMCVIRDGTKPIAAAMLFHGWGVTEVPSASSLRSYNPSCANMLLYWHLLERAIQRGQRVFDFGRSTIDSNTYRFKKQWGAEPVPAAWQYHLRSGQLDDARRDNPRYGKFIRIWQRLPVWVTRWLGPPIVRCIP